MAIAPPFSLKNGEARPGLSCCMRFLSANNAANISTAFDNDPGDLPVDSHKSTMFTICRGGGRVSSAILRCRAASNFAQLAREDLLTRLSEILRFPDSLPD